MDKYPVKKYPEVGVAVQGFVSPQIPKRTLPLPKFTESLSWHSRGTGRLTNPMLIGYSIILVGVQPVGC